MALRKPSGGNDVSVMDMRGKAINALLQAERRNDVEMISIAVRTLIHLIEADEIFDIFNDDQTNRSVYGKEGLASRLKLHENGVYERLKKFGSTIKKLRAATSSTAFIETSSQLRKDYKRVCAYVCDDLNKI